MDMEINNYDNQGTLENNHDIDHAYQGAIQDKLAPNERCAWGNWDGCPIQAPGSDPLCSRIDTGPGAAILCAAESPWFGGASFDVNQAMPGIITKIVTDLNRNNYCSVPTGVGNTSFHTHCACSGGCLTSGQWTVFYNATKA